MRFDFFYKEEGLKSKKRKVKLIFLEKNLDTNEWKKLQ